MKPLEQDIENKFARYVIQEGNECIKLNWRGRRHWPDRLIVLEYGQCFYIEFKRPGEKPRKAQVYLHDLLRRKGHRVYVCESFDAAKEIYQEEKARAEKINEIYTTSLSEKVYQLSDKK